MYKLKLITIEDLLEMRENGEPHRLVEVLLAEDFMKGHIPEAVSMPVDEIEVLAPKMLKKDETIVTYCSDYSCHASTNAARMLMEMGYSKVLDFKAGKRGWMHSGFPLLEVKNEK